MRACAWGLPHPVGVRDTVGGGVAALDGTVRFANDAATEFLLRASVEVAEGEVPASAGTTGGRRTGGEKLTLVTYMYYSAGA